jgi:predicted metal-dependent phosphoesterase TrpH
MPAGQPFTQLCQALNRPRHYGRVDLHLHTTYSDGLYTPAQLVDLARRSGLSAIAVTDHDTFAGVVPARQAASASVEVIAGVEITAEFRGKELHLLGYDFDLTNEPLHVALAHLQEQRVGRFHEMIERLGSLGVHFTDKEVAEWTRAPSLGRRHLAEMLVRAKKASSIREAFQRWLGDERKATVPKTRLPVADAIKLVRDAGGVASWAHPNYHCTRETLLELKSCGLAAIEAEYPAFRASRVHELRQLAETLGLAISGGSDCHGPDELKRAVGTCSISRDEWNRLRERS